DTTYMRIFIGIFGILFLLSSCIVNEESNQGIPKIVCTTGMLGDAVENILKGTGVEIITLMKAGVDPHLYKATQGDVKSLIESNMIVYNGLHLEGKMAEVFEKLQNRKKIIVASDGITTNR